MAENYYGITDVGMQRSNNEDAFIAEEVMHHHFITACVIDGLGGYEGGEIAASLAKDAITKQLKEAEEGSKALLKQAVFAAHEAIITEKKPGAGNDQMACVLTLALVDIKHNKLIYAHVGDTRLYLLRDSSLIKLTHDHSFVGMLEDSGRLSEEAAMSHPKRNEINRAVGFESFSVDDDYIETGESPFLPGDMLLLCSDGLSDMADTATIVNILTSDQSLAAKGKSLIHAANEAGGRDNITAVLVHNDKAPLKHEPTLPAAAKKGDDAKRKETVVVVKKKRRSIMPFLVFLCLLLLAAVAWLLYQDYKNKKQHEAEANNQIVIRKHNEKEQLLADSIDNTTTNEVFVVNSSGSEPVVITDSIFINKDTLHIIGNGVTLTCDTAYKGPAFILSPSCKYILLDSMTFENFEIGVAIKNHALHLKNVQFKNCRVPVQYNFMLNDRPVINGRFADTVFYNSDIAP